MRDSQMSEPTESPEDHRPGFFCVYEIYFKGCGLTFPLPEALVRYLAALEIALPQLTPNLLRTILCIITIAAEAGFVIRVPELNELLSVRSSSKKTGYFSAYPNANQNLISNLLNKDENWHHPWFLVKKTPASIGNLSDMLPSKWSAKPAFITLTLPNLTVEFVEFFKIVIEGETLWNSFTLDRFVEANHKLMTNPPGQLLQLPPPPPLPHGTSARAIASRRKTLSKPMTEACEANKSFLQSAVDKKEYSRTLLVDDGSAEGARSAGAYRPTPHREGHGSRSPRRDQSPRRDSPRPASQTRLSSEPIADLYRKKRERATRSSSSPKRDKTRARTDRSPRLSPPPRSIGPPPPVIASSSKFGSEKTGQSENPRREEVEPRDVNPKAVLVPQTKSFTRYDGNRGNVFRCFKTRQDTILPTFDRWRPAIRERFLLHAYHSSRANSELNDMIEYYERLLLDREQEVLAWKDMFSSLESELRSSTDARQKLEDQLDNLSSELMKSNDELQDQYQRYDKIQEELSNARDRLSESESSAYDLSNQLSELQLKYKAIAKLLDAELARSASKARKEVKGHGMELIQGAIVFIQTEKARTELESDIKEYESNLLLLDQTHDKDSSEKQERSELEADLAEKRSLLVALPSSSFNPQQFEEFFTDSPPLSESGLDWAGPSDPVEPEVSVIPVETPEMAAIPPVIPPPTNSETVVIEDDDGSEFGMPTEQLTANEPDETETAAADPVDPEPTQPELEVAEDP
ncbi:hypothetical protein AXX17_AT5G31040 [Arabidopsis thaliana]|uniref:Myosin heavy chain-like protein n=2 Tax=Arabidopsis TaxID=3701 RepID=A0A178UN99_ARATH|nr:hypothetical protein AXX17_AT5G31040 [Arabidopsis thaliana]